MTDSNASYTSRHCVATRLKFFIFGSISLLLGLLYYLYLRETPPSILQSISIFMGISNTANNSLSFIYPDWVYAIPSFIYIVIFSFISLSVVTLSPRSILIIPIIWLSISIVFELGQGLAEIIDPLITDSRWSIFQLLHHYIVNGTYAFADIIAASFGAIFVYVVAYVIQKQESIHCPVNLKVTLSRLSQAILVGVVFLAGIFSLIGSYTCERSDGSECGYHYNALPVYMSYDELRNSSINAVQNQPLTKTGKIYLYQNYLLINSPNQGVHIYDNSDPTNPQKLTFINIPGNLDIAIKQDYLYVDSYIDLVTIDISDINAINEVDRVIDMFPYNPYQNIAPGIFFGPIDREKGVVIDYVY